MPNADLLGLARSVLEENRPSNRDTALDSRGTPPEIASQGAAGAGTVKGAQNPADMLGVPPSANRGRDSGTVRKSWDTAWDSRGTVAICGDVGCTQIWVPGCDRSRSLATGNSRCQFLSRQAGHPGTCARMDVPRAVRSASAPHRPAATYHRLARYDATGLIWLLQGCVVVARTENEAAIQGGGGVVVYRKHGKPALGPLGDSLSDMGARYGTLPPSPNSP